MDVHHDEGVDTLNEAANDLPAGTLTLKHGSSKSKSIADLLMKKLDERNSLIKKIIDQNQQIF